VVDLGSDVEDIRIGITPSHGNLLAALLNLSQFPQRRPILRRTVLASGLVERGHLLCGETVVVAGFPAAWVQRLLRLQ
jgi:hypothetical protein